MEQMQSLKQEISALLPAFSIRQEELLSKHTSFRIGGPAELMVFPGNPQELSSVLGAAHRHGIRPMILGAGTNILAPDEGIRGLVICLRECFMGLTLLPGNRVEAMAGMTLAQTAMFAARNGLSGLEFAHGIPGTVGGGVYMNAGAYGGEMSQIIEWVRVWTPDGVKKWNVDEMGFGYRHSRLMEENAVVLAACLKLQVGEREAIRSQMKELMQQRKSKQPLEYPSAGSFFKRPQGHFAGALIENAGLKGFTIGGAQISEKHAGFLINHNHATAADVLNVMRAVQEKVFEETGVQMENEVRIVGKDQ